jgi:hypothetical protein
MTNATVASANLAGFIYSEFNKTKVKAKTYAGIGSRNTPKEILELMTEIAKALSAKGYTLNSGAAPGADKAFEAGAGSKNVYIPWVGFGEGICNLSREVMDTVDRYHTHPQGLSVGARKLMARNSQQVLGECLNSPVEFVVCWTPDGVETDSMRTVKTGGTGQAISIADLNGIKVYNLFNERSRIAVAGLCGKIKKN